MTDKYHELTLRLKACRVTAGFKSARNFSTAYGIPEKTYSQHENGKRKIPIESLLDYSEYLKVNPFWLLSGEGFPSDCDDFNNEVYEYLYLQHGQKLVLPKLHIDKKSQIDGKLLADVLSSSIEVVSKNNIKMDYDKLIEFAYSVYNSIIDTSTDEKTRANLINLATKSLLTGSNSQIGEIKNIKTS
jgi:hypothetical protein